MSADGEDHDDQRDLNRGHKRHQDQELRFFGLVVADDHAEDSAKCAEQCGETEKVTLGNAESVFLRFFLVGMKQSKGYQVRKQKQHQKDLASGTDEVAYRFHYGLLKR